MEEEEEGEGEDKSEMWREPASHQAPGNADRRYQVFKFSTPEILSISRCH